MKKSMRSIVVGLAWLVCAAIIGRTGGAPALGAETAHDFSKWEKDIAAFEAMDRTSPPPQGGVLFTGSSTIRLWHSLSNDFPGCNVIKRGFGGSEIVDCTHFAERIIFPYQPRMIVLRSGGNDLNGGKTPEQVFADFQNFVATVWAKLPDTEIVYISLNPTLARMAQAESSKTANRLIEEYIRKTPRLKYVDIYSMALGPDGQPRLEFFASDKLHFNEQGYRLLADRVRPFLVK